MKRKRLQDCIFFWQKKKKSSETEFTSFLTSAFVSTKQDLIKTDFFKSNKNFTTNKLLPIIVLKFLLGY